MKSIVRVITSGAIFGLLCACTTGLGSPATSASGPVAAPETGWTTATREHIDLWLHGYALLTSDTARVPLFQRGYREHMRALRSKRGVFTQLDANADKLSARFRINPALVNGQFLPFYFSSFQEIQQVTDLFLRSDGNPQSANDPTVRQQFAVIAAAFPTAADRDWLRLFVQSLADESARFYQGYWTAEQGTRSNVRQAVDLVLRQYQPRLQRFLNNTQQPSGSIILSLPLGGEGRTVALSRQQSEVAVGYPSSADSAVEALYVFAHETVNAITGPAITDNTTPAEQRSGAAGTYSANANVRAGALLLQRVAPDLAGGYMRYYLRTAGLSAPAGDPSVAFATAFPIPDTIRDAITRQLDVVLGGI